MHPRLAAVIARADRARTELLAAVDQIPSELREARPSLEVWSVAEVLEHLARVEKGIAKVAALKIGELQTMPNPPREAPDDLPIDASRFAMVVDRVTRKIEAPERVRPSGEVSAEAARSVLMTTRGLLLDQFHAADGVALSTAIHPHPFLGDLNLYEWVYFIAVHEERHTLQIREIAGQLASV